MLRRLLFVFSAAAIGASAAAPVAQASCDKTVTVVSGSAIIPGSQYPTISGAVSYADNQPDTAYYCIEVMPGTYINDFPYVTRPMTIENPNYPVQQVVLKATKNLPNDKGIILTVSSLTVNGLTFTGAQIPNYLGGNGAGIRDQNTGPATLLVQNSTFSGNQEGILTGDDSNETITISNSYFINNGNPSQRYFQHALYVNQAGGLTVQGSVFCGQLIGHDIKSRARMTTIDSNNLYDGAVPGPGDPNSGLGCNAGSTSLAIDVPNGGQAAISHNNIFQGAATQNYKLVDYGEEGLAYGNNTSPNNSFLVSNNAFISTGTPNATAIYDPNCVTAQLSNNSFSGITTVVDPPRCAVY
jgi:hypothetical protein